MPPDSSPPTTFQMGAMALAQRQRVKRKPTPFFQLSTATARQHVLRASLRTSVVFLQTVIPKERMGANLHPRPPKNVHSSIAKLQPTYVKYIALIHLALAFPKAMLNQMTYNLKNRSPGMNILLVKDL